MSKQTPGRLNIVNRDEFPVFQPSPVIPYKIKRRIKSVKMKLVDHEEKYRKAKEAGLPVDVVNSMSYTQLPGTSFDVISCVSVIVFVVDSDSSNTSDPIRLRTVIFNLSPLLIMYGVPSENAISTLNTAESPFVILIILFETFSILHHRLHFCVL